ncbi:MAG: ATP synthase F1 subunit delta [Firmicutes bacterium]|nr:ATP synthase F1 subunit delta [Bacillota bacterium]
MNELVADRYARALLEIGMQKGNTDVYYRDLKYIGDHLNMYEPLRKAVEAPSVPSSVKKNILIELFFKRVEKDVINTLCLIVDKERQQYIDDIIRCYWKRLNELKNIIVATVVTAVPAPADMPAKLKATLTKQTGRQVEIIMKEDPSIIGGIQIIVDDNIHDFSIRGRLDGLEKHMNNLPIGKF